MIDRQCTPCIWSWSVEGHARPQDQQPRPLANEACELPPHQLVAACTATPSDSESDPLRASRQTITSDYIACDGSQAACYVTARVQANYASSVRLSFRNENMPGAVARRQLSLERRRVSRGEHVV